MQPVSGLWEGKKLKLKLGCRILPEDQMVKNLPVMQETWVQSMGQEGPLEKGMATTPEFLPGEFHGPRSLASYSPWGHKELDTTE